MSTLSQATLYRFREGGFPEIPRQSLAQASSQDRVSELQDLFVSTQQLDNSQEDHDPRVGSVQLDFDETDPSLHEGETRTFQGDANSGQLTICEDRWSCSSSENDRNHLQDVRFNGKAVDALDMVETADGLKVHVWHIDRFNSNLSFEQVW